MRYKTVLSIIKNIAIWCISLTMMIPLLLVLINSLKDKYQASSMGLDLPRSLHFENFLVVIEQGKLIRSFFNSMLYSGFAIVLGILLTSMAAYVLARNRTKLNRFLYFFMVLGIAMPINYVTLTKVMQFTHLNNTQIGLCLLYTATSIPFSIFLAYGFMGTIPRELDEAGIIDGCSPINLFFSVIFPLLKPVVVTMGVLNFMGVWNDFINPLYFANDASKWPMTLAVYNFFSMFSSSMSELSGWNFVSADIVLTSLPVIIIYILGQKYIISGMTAGSVKG